MCTRGTSAFSEETAMAKRSKRRVYTVIEVWRGMAVAATTFRTLAAARGLVRRLNRKYDPMEGDVQLFEGII